MNKKTNVIFYSERAIELTVRVGSTYHHKDGQVSQVRQFFQHPNFSIDTYDYDVSVLWLQTPLVLGSSVRNISLASSGTNIPTGLIGYASGWGLTDPYGFVGSDHLKYVVLPVISLKDCGIYYSNLLTDRMFCAGYATGGKDTCQVSSILIL